MIASTNHFLFMAILAHDYNRQRQRSPLAGRYVAGRAQRGSFQSAASLNCSVLITLELRLVIENHIQQ